MSNINSILLKRTCINQRFLPDCTSRSLSLSFSLSMGWLRMRCTCRRSHRAETSVTRRRRRLSACWWLSSMENACNFSTRLYFCRIRRRFTSLLCISSVCLPRNVAGYPRQQSPAATGRPLAAGRGEQGGKWLPCSNYTQSCAECALGERGPRQLWQVLLSKHA